MTDYGSRDIPLSWDVFVTACVPVVDNDLPPGEKQRLWPPISSTLISGEGHAVLVDAFITVAQTRALVDWVVASRKDLTTIYATHGHGDHFFGATGNPRLRMGDYLEAYLESRRKLGTMREHVVEHGKMLAKPYLYPTLDHARPS